MDLNHTRLPVPPPEHLAVKKVFHEREQFLIYARLFVFANVKISIFAIFLRFFRFQSQFPSKLKLSDSVVRQVALVKS